MKDKELRKLIGSRAKQRRLELNLTQPYVADKMGVTASTILRYENGSIDNTKKMVLEGLSEALHVSIEWLKGETDEYETDITDKKELQIRDEMSDILKQLPLDLDQKEDTFSKDLLLLMLKQYNLFLESFRFACKKYKGSSNEADIAKAMGFESTDEYNEIMFLREITHTVNAFMTWQTSYGSIPENRKRQNKGLRHFCPRLLPKILIRYRMATGVMLY